MFCLSVVCSRTLAQVLNGRIFGFEIFGLSFSNAIPKRSKKHSVGGLIPYITKTNGDKTKQMKTMRTPQTVSRTVCNHKWKIHYDIAWLVVCHLPHPLFVRPQFDRSWAQRISLKISFVDFWLCLRVRHVYCGSICANSTNEKRNEHKRNGRSEEKGTHPYKHT